MTLFEQGEFVASALQGSHFPVLRSEEGSILPEIALVGKSNVGKSSLINFLLRSRRLAKVSSTPGKTQTINFFAIDQKIALVDLPGYGYAKVPQNLRDAWSKQLEEYFQNRQPLRLILLLLDIRRTPNEEDLAMAKWSACMQKPLLVIFTKCDKLDSNQVSRSISSSMEILSKIDGLTLPDPIPVSIHDSSSRDRLIRSINTSLDKNGSIR
jgi:GTP-binding protein